MLSFIVLTWTAGFDIIYALQDEDFDKSKGLSSIPAKLGRVGALRLSVGIHTLTAILVFAVGIVGNFGWLYFLGAVVFTGLLILQHLLVKPNDISKVGVAFQTTNGYGSLLFAAFMIADMLF
jgi:4-hydroxybenzoate polyprenyltransferase